MSQREVRAGDKDWAVWLGTGAMVREVEGWVRGVVDVWVGECGRVGVASDYEVEA